MKKLILFITLLFTLTLFGCVSDPNTYYFDSNILLNNTMKIDLVYYQNDAPEMIVVDQSDFPNFEFGSSTVIETLDSSLLESFILELSLITFHIQNKSSNSPVGNTLILHQTNGNMIVISCTLIDGTAYSFVSTFDSDSHFIEHIARFADRPKFDEMLQKYFNSI